MAKLKFAYVATNTSGKEVKGSIEADTQLEAVAKIKGQALNIVSIKSSSSRGGGLFGGGASRSAKVSELALFTRQLATMISAGIPLLEGLEILADQTKDTNKGFGLGLQEAADLIRGGSELSDALSKYPRIFPAIYVNMIKAGEASGQLDTILNRLADFMEASEALKSEIKGAMTYPVISLILIFGISGYLLIGVVPKFQKMFDALGGKLPFITVLVVTISQWLQNNVITTLLIIVGFIVGYKLWGKTDQGRRMLDTFWLKFPVFGPLFQKVAISRFARTFATLLASGVPILGALEIVATTSGNKVLEDTLLQTRETVKRGEQITTALATSWIFPTMVVKMIGIGERSGALEQLLSKVAEFYDAQVHATTKQLTSLIEPIMLIVMGTVVGVIVLAIFYPILELQSAVRGGG